MAAPGFQGARKPVARTLSRQQVQPLVTEAFARWQAAGVDTTALHGIDIRIADLGGATLGLASGHTIYLDDNAAGWGWFVDRTPRDDSEFTTPGNQGEQHRMDLLTVLAHEIGHLLGQEHADDGVMIETLETGIRRLPGSSEVHDWSAIIDVLVAGPRASEGGSVLATLPISGHLARFKVAKSWQRCQPRPTWKWCVCV